MSSKYLVSALGNAIVDILILIDDNFLIENSITKGSMTLIDKVTAEKLSLLEYQKISAGGSACNSVAAISALGTKCSFTGKIGKGQFGKIFSKNLSEINCDFNAQYSDLNNSTSKSFILVSKEDGERTMLTYLGESSELEDIHNQEIINNSEIIYIEGYLWDKENTISILENITEEAKNNRKITAFTLSDSFCVSRHKESFLKLIKNIDILFANEDEIKILTDITGAILEHYKYDNIFKINPNIKIIVTMAANGSAVITKDNLQHIKTSKIDNITDSTGAGDAFAAGFLFSLSNHLNLEESAKIGNLLASKIIQKIGARFNNEDINEIQKELCQFGV
jgi:sugar/nucleoside kinase (ribokinase family)